MEATEATNITSIVEMLGSAGTFLLGAIFLWLKFGLPALRDRKESAPESAPESRKQSDGLSEEIRGDYREIAATLDAVQRQTADTLALVKDCQVRLIELGVKK